MTTFTIIGAGVTGLASALRLAQAGLDVTVLDLGHRAGQGVTSRNSQVLHAGLYYPTHSLKARLCVAGRHALLDFCRTHHVPHALIGKLIVATSPNEEGELHRLLAQGQANGVTDLELVSKARVQHREPRVRATTALWSPSTGILDVPSLVAALEAECARLGVTFAYRHRVTAIDRTTAGYRLTIAGPDGAPFELDTHAVVNAAGLHADSIAALAGIDVDAAGYRQHWVKGSYFRLKTRGLRHLVYPVPARHLAGLGVHVTVGLDGETRLGPDVEPLPSRAEHYAVDDTKAATFAAAAGRYLDGLTADELAPDQAGLRPKLSRPGEPWRDFVIAEESRRGLPGFVNCLGLESPGLTACLAVGAEVAALLGVATPRP